MSKYSELAKEMLESEALCNERYCPWFNEEHGINSLCEGSCCKEAMENYIDELPDEEDGR